MKFILKGNFERILNNLITRWKGEESEEENERKVIDNVK